MFLFPEMTGREGTLGIGPQSFIITFLILWLKNFGNFNFDGWFIKLSVHKFQIVAWVILCIINHYWGCTSIYRSLSYPLRSLLKKYIQDLNTGFLQCFTQ